MRCTDPIRLMRMVSPCFALVQLGVLPLRGVPQLAHHVRDPVRGDANASQLAITARSHTAVKSAFALWSIA